MRGGEPLQKGEEPPLCRGRAGAWTVAVAAGGRAGSGGKEAVAGEKPGFQVDGGSGRER